MYIIFLRDSRPIAFKLTWHILTLNVTSWFSIGVLIGGFSLLPSSSSGGWLFPLWRYHCRLLALLIIISLNNLWLEPADSSSHSYTNGVVWLLQPELWLSMVMMPGTWNHQDNRMEPGGKAIQSLVNDGLVWWLLAKGSQVCHAGSNGLPACGRSAQV